MGDNEQHEYLFGFRVVDGAVVRGEQTRIPLALDKDLSDIEAMVTLAGDRVLVIGSHSRNTRCKARKGRRRFAEVTLPGNKDARVPVVQSRKIRCSRLFDNPLAGNAVVQAVCEAIDGAEDRAEGLEKRLEHGEVTVDAAKAECNQILPFNAEGAVAVRGADETRVWIGLRAPLLAKLPGDPEHHDLAILLRMKGLDAWKFDRIALLDLEGRGIRELTRAGGHIWVIAGPAGDRRTPFQLRRFPSRALATAEVIATKRVEILPPSSEGLVIAGHRAYVVIDGDKGGEGAVACTRPSTLLEIDLQ